MMRMRMTMAAVLAAGGLLLAPESAHACAAHGQAARTATGSKDATRKDVAKKDTAVRPLEELDSLMAAKCKCGSAADCTCKKGTCDCAKCKKPRRQVVDALGDQGKLPEVQEARYDASAGVFI